MTNSTARSAIRTRYHGPTDTRGHVLRSHARFIATDSVDRITVPYNYDTDETENHCIAAQAFLDKHNPYETKLNTNALCFDNDFYWTWKITGPCKKENK